MEQNKVRRNSGGDVNYKEGEEHIPSTQSEYFFEEWSHNKVLQKSQSESEEVIENRISNLNFKEKLNEPTRNLSKVKQIFLNEPQNQSRSLGNHNEKEEKQIHKKLEQMYEFYSFIILVHF